MDLDRLRQQALLIRDRVSPSSTRYRIRVDGCIIRNNDGSLPWLRSLNNASAVLVPGYEEGMLMYQARVVGYCPVERGQYEVSVDAGRTWSAVRLMGPARRDAGNNAWLITLGQRP